MGLRIALLLILVVSYFSCQQINCLEGNGETSIQEYDISEFKGLVFRTSGNVFLSKSAKHKIKIEAAENLFEHLEVNTENGVLVIDSKKCIKSENVNIYLQTPDINNVKLEGSGSIVSTDSFEVEQLSIVVAGSGDVDMKAIADNVKARIAGSGSLMLHGEAGTFEVEINGSGDVEAMDLYSKRVTIGINGSGDVRVSVSSFLVASINGSGNVIYAGSPQITKKVAGSGEIRQAYIDD